MSQPGLDRTATETSRRERVPWRTLTPTALIPNLLHGAGQGAVVPAIPIAALEIGGSYAKAAVVAAMLPAGQLVCALPAGSFVNRFNEKTAMLTAGVVTAMGGVGAFFAATLLTLMVSVFLIGGGVAVFTMARHTWITVAVPVEVRGRSLSLVAGFNRLGMMAGPFLAAVAFAVADEVRSAFITVVATSTLLVVLVSFTRFPVEPPADENLEEMPRVFRTMWENRGVLIRLGLLMSIVSTLRTTRQTFVPLVGVALGMDEVTIALIVGYASAIDFSLFYVGGLIVDRMGRLWVAVPTLAIFGASHFVLAVADRLPDGRIWFTAAVMVMAVGNGISAGVVATMGSDLADPRKPAAFLGSWRLVTELGPSLAPLAIAAVIATVSLGVGCAAAGALALLGAVALPRYVHRYLPATAHQRLRSGQST
jgi:MFS family permease